MSQRWKNRPEGSNWGEFGNDDQLGRLNLLTPEKVLEAIAEVKTGKVFSLSLPLNLPGGNVLNPSRHAPRLTATIRPDGKPFYLHSLSHDHNTTDVVCDDMVTLCLQYSTQWDGLSHVGSHFDADGDGKAEKVFYNGFRPEDFSHPRQTTDGSSKAHKLGIEHMATHGIQGRAILLDLRKHFGDERRVVGYDDLMHVINSDKIEVRRGDMVCMHTGFADLILSMNGEPDAEKLARSCCVLDGADSKLRNWIADSGLAVLIADNYAVEHRPYDFEGDGCSALLPLHELCLFKLGIHLGELWHLTPLATWLNQNNRHAFMLTAPPLRLPGAVGSPLNPIATV